LAGSEFRVLIAIAAARDRGKDTVTISIEEIAVKTRIGATFKLQFADFEEHDAELVLDVDAASRWIT
jgi:hypothetical protein